MKSFEEQFWSGGSLEAIYNKYAQNPSNPLALIFVNAINEFRRSLADRKKTGASIKIQERIDKVMQIAIDKQVDKMETKKKLERILVRFFPPGIILEYKDTSGIIENKSIDLLNLLSSNPSQTIFAANVEE